MSGLTYDAVAKFAQQGGTAYFALMFIACLIYALWPKNGSEFKRMAALALDPNEDDHGQS